MFRFALLALFASLSFAQDPSEVFNKPPAKVDEALRARIDEFYQDHVKQQFKKAEALVAPDTKDFFYSHNKPPYLTCETGKISYSDNFKRAKATVVCEQYLMIPGFEGKRLKVPHASTWKVIGGKWYWYVDQEEIKKTPFGTMTAGAPGPGGGPPATMPTNGDFILKFVQADPTSVTLKPGEAQTVTIHNSAPGNLTIGIFGRIPGVDVTIDHLRLKVGDQAVLTLQATEAARPGTISVRVEETGQLIPIQVSMK